MGRRKRGRGSSGASSTRGDRPGYDIRMAWRITDHMVDGELDNTVKGRVTGWLRLTGRGEPVRLELTGSPERGHCTESSRVLANAASALRRGK